MSRIFIKLNNLNIFIKSNRSYKTEKLTSLIANPNPTLKNIGSSTSNIYQPKLLRVCVIANAQKGIDVAIWRQGTRLVFLLVYHKKDFFYINFVYS